MGINMWRTSIATTTKMKLLIFVCLVLVAIFSLAESFQLRQKVAQMPQPPRGPPPGDRPPGPPPFGGSPPGQAKKAGGNAGTSQTVEAPSGATTDTTSPDATTSTS